MVPDNVRVPAPFLVKVPVPISIGSLIFVVPIESIVRLYVPVTALPEDGFIVNNDPESI